MASALPLMIDFSAGEFDRDVFYRNDLKQYGAACETLENMLVVPQGAAFRRPGTEFVNPVPISVTFTTTELFNYTLIPDLDDLRVLTTATGVRLSGDANDLGGGLVGLPSAGHGFSAGDMIQITGTTNYDTPSTSPIEVHADTTDNQIVITDSFVSETFNGDPVVMLCFIDILDNEGTQGYSCVVGDYLYLPVTYNGAGNSTCIVRIDLTTWTYEGDWADAPPAGWGGSESGYAVEATDDEQYIILRTVDNEPTAFYKYDLNGSCIAVYTHEDAVSPGYALAVDGQGRAYGAVFRDLDNQSNGYVGMRTNSSLSADNQYYDAYTSFIPDTSILLDDEYAYFIGRQLGTPPMGAGEEWPLQKYDITSSDTLVNPTEETNITGMSNGDYIQMAVLNDGYIYCITDTFSYAGSNKNLFILDTADFSVVGTPGYVAWKTTLWVNGDYLFVARASNHSGDDTILYFALDDVSTPAGTINAGLVQTTSQLIAHDRCLVYTDSETTYTIDTTPPYTENFAVRLIPFGVSTTDSYVLEFGDHYMGVFENGGQVEN